VVYCSFLGIPALLDGAFQVIAQFLGAVDLSCHSKAVDALAGLKWLSALTVAIVIVAVVLHSAGVINIIDWFFPDLEKRRFDNLKQRPFVEAIEPMDEPEGGD
jgi:hypothetical protein